jgi:hypothetical protein
MAITHPAGGAARAPSLLWSRLHFLLRFLGLTGALAAAVGLVLIEPRTWQDCLDAVLGQVYSTAKVGGYLLACGAALALLALVVEALVIMRVAAGRRSAFGFNAVVQMALAAALLVGLNVWSFRHSLQFDWTRDKEHTLAQYLPEKLREQLGQLDQAGETKVIVYLRNRDVGDTSEPAEKMDFDTERALLRQTTYRNAANRKVVEKIKDLVSLLRQVGPQLRVEVLDMREEGFDDKLSRLTKDSPELMRAIAAAPENRIFIQGKGGQLQQLDFNEFYQLDLPASEKADKGRGNLVLLGQGEDGRGIEPFVQKILNLEQRRPRVGLLVIHPYLTSEGSEPTLTLSGLARALNLHGFDVKDVILKKWDTPAPEPEPAADTFAESRLETLESKLSDLEDDVKGLAVEQKQLKTQIAEMTLKPGENMARKLEELSEKYKRQLGGNKLTAADLAVNLTLRRRGLQQIEEALAAARKERDEVRRERNKLDVEKLSESRRLTDVKAKLSYALADCDLLLIPRLTRMPDGERTIPPRLYRLDPQQVAAIRDFVKSGKPILACFGPVNEHPATRMPRGPTGPDGLDFLLSDLGFKLGRQTILTAADSKAFSERRLGPLGGGSLADVLPLDFDSPTESARGPWQSRKASREPNLLRRGLQVTSHSMGKAFDVRMRFPRPIYYEPSRGRKMDRDPVFLLSPIGWNEDQPYPTGQRRPRFTPPAPDDPNTGTRDARRRGHFPVGVAVETTLPEDWGKDSKGRTVRVAAIGHGGVFVGPRLSAAQERLLLQTANWLLGREAYLPRADHEWRYPRLALVPEDPEHTLWLWGTRLGLPVLFAYLGCVVVLFRRLR